MPISLNNHIAQPLKLTHNGNTYKVGHPTRTILISIAIGFFTLGIGGVVAFYAMTYDDKRKKFKLIHQFTDLTKDPNLSSNMKLQDAQKILKYAVLFFESEQGKNLPNVQNHLQKLKSILKISYKQEELIKFINDHPHRDMTFINPHLYKKTGIVFHHGMPFQVTKDIDGRRVTEVKKQDSRPAIKDSPIAYAKSFLIADRNSSFPQFTRTMLTKACLEANYEQLIVEWMLEEEGFVDLVKSPEGNIDKDIFQIIGAYFNVFRRMKLREFLALHPEKKHLAPEAQINDADFNKFLTKKDFLAFLRDPKRDILPFTPLKGKFEEHKVKVDQENIEEMVDLVADATSIFEM